MDASKVGDFVMKKILIIVVAAALSACAVEQPRYVNQVAPSDPSQWRVVSVTPVAPGTGERMAANGSAARVESSGSYVSQPTYQPQPVYASAPVYAAPQVVYQPSVVYPAPVYAPPPSYYYPPVALSFGLGLVFGHHWSHGGRRYHRR